MKPTMERLNYESSLGSVSYLYRAGSIPLIFLHGLGGTGNTWLKLTSLLDDRFGLYYLDLLCQGRSQIKEGGCTITDQCRMINEFAQALGFKKFGLVGNSYGGWISLRYALEYKPKPEYLVLIDSAGLNPSVGEGDPALSAAFVDRVMTMSRYNRREVIEKIIENNSRPEERIRPQDLGKIMSRTLVIWGELDALIPPAFGKKMHEYIHGSSFHVIPGGGHVPQTAHYTEIASLITSFIRE